MLDMVTLSRFVDALGLPAATRDRLAPRSASGGVEAGTRLAPAGLATVESPKRRVPHGITLIGRLFEEGTLGRAGIALERAFGVSAERPPNT